MSLWYSPHGDSQKNVFTSGRLGSIKPKEWHVSGPVSLLGLLIGACVGSPYRRGWLRDSCFIKNCTSAWLTALGKIALRRLLKDGQQRHPAASFPEIAFSFHNLGEQPCKLFGCPEPLDIVGCLHPEEIAPQQTPTHRLLSFHAYRVDVCPNWKV